MLNKTIATLALLAVVTISFSQTVIYTENFQNSDTNWTFDYEYESEDMWSDTAFAGVANNKLTVMAYQGMGCPFAQAFIEYEDNFTWTNTTYKLDFYFDSLMYGLATDTYIEVTLKGQSINFPIYNILEVNAKRLSFIKNDSIYFEIDSASSAQLPSGQTFDFSVEAIDNMNFSMNIYSRGCGADLGHGAGMVIDSIRLIDNPTFTSPVSVYANKRLVKTHSLFTLEQNNSNIILNFQNQQSNLKTISLYSIDGKLLKHFSTENSDFEIPTNTINKQLVIIKVNNGFNCQTQKVLLK